MSAKTCTRCGGTDSVGPLPKRYACKTCGPRGLCYACDVSHNTWCPPAARTER